MACRKAHTSVYVQPSRGFTRMKGGHPGLLGQNSSWPTALGSPLHMPPAPDATPHGGCPVAGRSMHAQWGWLPEMRSGALEGEGVPAGAQEYGLYAGCRDERLDTGLEAARQLVHLQAIQLVGRMHKVQDLREVVVAGEEECEDAAEAWNHATSLEGSRAMVIPSQREQPHGTCVGCRAAIGQRVGVKSDSGSQDVQQYCGVLAPVEAERAAASPADRATVMLTTGA